MSMCYRGGPCPHAIARLQRADASEGRSSLAYKQTTEPPHSQQRHRLGVAVQQLAPAQAHSGPEQEGQEEGSNSAGEDLFTGGEDDVE
eukprot:scaffold31330_cov18-Tisochrysis_lutea.AAC.1